MLEWTSGWSCGGCRWVEKLGTYTECMHVMLMGVWGIGYGRLDEILLACVFPAMDNVQEPCAPALLAFYKFLSQMSNVRRAAWLWGSCC